MIIEGTEVQPIKGRDGWEATSMHHIPGQPLAYDEQGNIYTHVRVATRKSVAKGIYCSAMEVWVRSDGSWGCSLAGMNDRNKQLGFSTGQCTEKNVAILHGLSLAKLKELRPELFPPAPGDMVKRHTPIQGAPNPSFKVLEVRDGILVTEHGNVPASEYMVVRITEEQSA